MSLQTEQYRPRLACEFHGKRNLLEAKERLESFVAANPRKHLCRGDDSTTTYCSVGLLLMAAAVSGSRDHAELAAVTGFLQEFPHAVLDIMDRRKLWETDWFLDLSATLMLQESTMDSIIGSSEWAMERFWSAAWSHNLVVWLEICRARLVFGGLMQDYVDLGFRNEFLC